MAEPEKKIHRSGYIQADVGDCHFAAAHNKSSVCGLRSAPAVCENGRGFHDGIFYALGFLAFC